MLHWRPPHRNGVQFAELDSYEIRGLSAIISRNVPNNRIRYILGATGQGGRRLRRVPSKRVSRIDYVFIDSDETVRAWLLSNPVLNDTLDLMIYCYRDKGDTRPATPSLRAHQYLHEDAVADWADSAADIWGTCITGLNIYCLDLITETPIDQGITKMETPQVFPFQDHPPRHLMSRTPGLRVRTATGCRYPLSVTLLHPPWLVLRSLSNL